MSGGSWVQSPVWPSFLFNRHIASDAWVDGLPGGHSKECFSRKFHPSRESFMSCKSSILERCHCVLYWAWRLQLG